MRSRPLLLLAVLLLAGCGRGRAPEAKGDLLAQLSQPWPEIERQARGQTVTLAMWMGDPYINKYINEYVAPNLKQSYGINLNVVSAQGAQIVSMLMTEIEAHKPQSNVDLIWINGETFYQLRQIDALLGPFTDMLPNAKLIDFKNPFIGYDFQQEVKGYECPWGNVQLAIIYNSARVPDPPRNRQQLADWVKAHPGRFTFDNSFTGMTFLKSLLIDMAGGAGSLDGPFDEAKYKRLSAELWDYLNGIKKYFWKQGETFPASVAQLHQLFAAGEVDFTMSNNDGEVDNKVLQGLLPETSRAYVLDTGTIQNTHYMGIARRAPHLAGDLVTMNFLISPEAQYEKLKPAVWGDGTVLDVGRLPGDWQAKFADVPQRRFSPKRVDIQPKALREPASEIMIRLSDDFRKQVLEK
ncbi:MAG TPA: ABC transporter substrate-binding protein [Thermoanaerobaculia bacterium]|jgi:putative spermidine/putrescine transport system substrate-binding protein|nr:ABC transporter substrate-binding protein [Thermoanaerobaculia bacterium]